MILPAFSVILFPKVNANSSIVYVNHKNSIGPWLGTIDDPFILIQDAIDEVSEDGFVYIFNGTYKQEISINKSIGLIAFNDQGIIIDGQGFETAITINADNVTVKGFIIENSSYGIRIFDSSDCVIIENTFSNCDYGIYFSESNYNKIYHNNFFNNKENGYDMGNNSWDDGYTSGGNYWFDYSGFDIDKNGIGDIPYNVSNGIAKDRYPLFKPINKAPFIGFTYDPENPATDDYIYFSDQSNDDGYIRSRIWDFGDGRVSADRNPSHKYDDDGIYEIKLRVVDNLNSSNELIREIIVRNVPPSASFSFTPRNPTDIEIIKFTDTSIDTDGNVTYWNWDFGDGNSTSTQNASHRYYDDGIYNITFDVTDDDGSVDTLYQQITIFNVPPSSSFYFIPKSPTTKEVINFTDNSYDQDGSIKKRSWDLGDGTTSNKTSVQHSYETAGEYRVVLTVTDDDGVTNTKIIKIRVTDKGASNEDDYSRNIVLLIVFIVFISVMIGFARYVSKKEE
jgi:parallel beta-helix repeat protein